MDGMDVFNFALQVVPKSIKEVLSKINIPLAEIDYLVFHQANQFMTDFFVKRLKFQSDKVPYCMNRFGNTSSASIPLTIVAELVEKLKNGDKIVMCGFGAGLSWGTVYNVFKDCRISPLIEY
jgi:3-oxoacyl-[acyl-carrier-protein] synthase-3